MTDCNFVYQSFYNIVPKTDTEYNTLYLGCGPMNIDDFPQDTAQYTVQLFGNFTGSTQPPTPTPSNTPTPTQTGTPAVTPTPSHTPGFTGFSADQQYAYTLDILGSFSGGSADFSGAYAPHPVFTNELGEAVQQLNAITIGGFNGLNN